MKKTIVFSMLSLAIGFSVGFFGFKEKPYHVSIGDKPVMVEVPYDHKDEPKLGTINVKSLKHLVTLKVVDGNRFEQGLVGKFFITFRTSDSTIAITSSEIVPASVKGNKMISDESIELVAE